MLNKSSKNSRQKIVFIGKSLFVVSEKDYSVIHNRTGLLKKLCYNMFVRHEHV